MFVRNAVLETLRQCRGHLLLETTLMSQVNITLAPAAGPTELARALEELRAKGVIEFVVDEVDPGLKRWRVRSAK